MSGEQRKPIPHEFKLKLLKVMQELHGNGLSIAEACRLTGQPMSRAARTALSSSSTTPADPGTTGTPAFAMAFLARLLSPIRRMACGPGPMNFKLQASQISAR